MVQWLSHGTTMLRGPLQGAMNILAPHADALFHRSVKCVRRGTGFRVGATVLAHRWVVDEMFLPQSKVQTGKSATNCMSGSSAMALSRSYQGGWAEPISSRKLQVRAAGMVKKPTGKTRDVALRAKRRGKVPAGEVLVYCFGDEIYRKVKVRGFSGTLILTFGSWGPFLHLGTALEDQHQ